MPESILRFLRFYASIVVMLVSSVLAFGITTVDKADAFVAPVAVNLVRIDPPHTTLPA